MIFRRSIFYGIFLGIWLFLGLVHSSVAADPKPAEPWVIVPIVVPPVPPVPAPGAVPVLPADSLYVLDCKEPCFVLTSPPGIVAAFAEAGPVKIRGKFVGGSGKFETRVFTGKTVISVEAQKSGRAELIVVKQGAKDEGDTFRQLIDSLVGPLPPPPVPPVPPLPPVPPEPPAPIPAPGLRVLVIYETAELSKMPPAQLNVLYSKPVRDALNARCAMGPDGKTREWRMWDKDVDAGAESKLWQDALKRPRTAVPWVIVSNPQKGGGHEGPLPGTVAEFLALVERFSGG